MQNYAETLGELNLNELRGGLLYPRSAVSPLREFMCYLTAKFLMRSHSWVDLKSQFYVCIKDVTPEMESFWGLLHKLSFLRKPQLCLLSNFMRNCKFGFLIKRFFTGLLLRDDVFSENLNHKFKGFVGQTSVFWSRIILVKQKAVFQNIIQNISIISRSTKSTLRAYHKLT